MCKYLSLQGVEGGGGGIRVQKIKFEEEGSEEGSEKCTKQSVVVGRV